MSYRVLFAPAHVACNVSVGGARHRLDGGHKHYAPSRLNKLE